MIILTATTTRPDSNTTQYREETQWLDNQALQNSYYTHLNTTYVNSGLATKVFEDIDALNYKTVMVFNNVEDYQTFIADPVLLELWAARNSFLSTTGQTSLYEVTGL